MTRTCGWLCVVLGSVTGAGAKAENCGFWCEHDCDVPAAHCLSWKTLSCLDIVYSAPTQVVQGMCCAQAFIGISEGSFAFPCCDPHTHSGGWDFDSDCDSASIYAAVAGWLEWGDDYCAFGGAFSPSSTDTEAVVSSSGYRHAELGSCWGCAPGWVWLSYSHTSWAVVDYNFSVSQSPSPLTGNWTIEARPAIGVLSEVPEGGIFRNGTLYIVQSGSTTLASHVAVVYSANNHRAGVNVSYDSGDGLWKATTTLHSSSGSASDIHAIQRGVQFNDRSLDVDVSGRFNSADVDGLEALLNTHDYDNLVRWDFDNNGTISTYDMSVLETIVAAELDSGVFGDANRSGAVDCDDLYLFDGAYGTVLGDPGYLITLDFDVNGEIDATDEAAAGALVCLIAGDVNCDGSLNPFDVQPFIDLIAGQISPCSACAGDLNLDGTANTFDITGFQSCLGT